MASIYDLIRAAALVIGLGFSARQDRKSWIWGDSILWGAYALGLFLFPASLFPGNDTAMMSFVIRVFASMMIAKETMWYLTRKTRDENVIGATLWSRLIGSILLLTFLTYNYFNHTKKFTEKALYFDMLAYAMLLLTSVFQFWRGEYRVGGREQKGNLNMLLRIIFLLMFMTGLMNMTFPSWVLPFKRLEVMEALGVRFSGSLIFCDSFVAFYAPSFRYDEDKSAFLLASIVGMVFHFVGLNLAYFVDGLFDHKEALYMHVGYLPLLLILLGLYFTWKKDAGNQSDYNLRSKSQ